MSSFIVGFDIGGTHVTAALVNAVDFSIYNDSLCVRAYPKVQKADPRVLVASWIECLNDLLQEFLLHCGETDRIIGFACGIPGPMDYQQGLCYIQSSTFDKFDRCYGMNIRCAFQYALRDLSSRWKTKYTLMKNFHQINSLRVPSSSISSDQIHILAALSMNVSSRTIADQGILPATLCTTDSKFFCGIHDANEDLPPLPIEEKRNSDRPSTSVLEENSFIFDRLAELPITFENDARCFALGEAIRENQKNYRRILALTLGTGFGSTFLNEKQVILDGDDVPPGGMLWNYPYDRHSISDQWFSSRGLNRIYQILQENSSIDENADDLDEIFSKYSTKTIFSYVSGLQIAERASEGDENAAKAYRIFGRLLGKFLIPILKKFSAELLVIGGGLTQAWYLFESDFKSILNQSSLSVDVYLNLSYDRSICLGAVENHCRRINSSDEKLTRKTSQNLLPVTKLIETSVYDLYPSHRISHGSIGVGHRSLHEKIIQLIDEHQLVLIDGFVGVDFDEYAEELMKFYWEKYSDRHLNKRLLIYDSRTFLRDDTDELRRNYFRSAKSIFGRVARDLDFRRDFIDPKKLHEFRENLSRPCVVIGPGAAFVSEIYPLIYIDLAKNELYYRIAAGTASSFFKPSVSADDEYPSTEDDYPLSATMFEQKSLYFLDYPLLNKLKVEILPRLSIFVDGQRPRCPTWIDGNQFRQSLVHLSHQTIRVRPWFEPGPWGGQWLKSSCAHLSQYPKNYAWSFEMIAPENGILLSDRENRLIEFSWEFFYGSQSRQVLGNDEHYRLFSAFDLFPIRFDFLDTIDGGNLSIQCHPNLQYMREKFGETITQDETYYIVETKEHWLGETLNDEEKPCVYLGFQADIDPEEFHQALITSRREQRELNVEKYIQSVRSNVHDFFLIPNETIHASGRNQVVLEISATPYIYTFKLYDWLRLGLDGQLRPLNIEHGIRNLEFHRHAEDFRCQPVLKQRFSNQYQEEILPTHSLHFYEVQRITFFANDETIDLIRSTENRFHLCMLVEGDAIEIRYKTLQNPSNDEIHRYNFIETFLIPASIGEYRLRPIHRNCSKSVLLIAYLKWNCSDLLR